MFKSLCVLMLCAPVAWRETYVRSLKRIGDQLGSDVVLRICAEIDETQTKPPQRTRRAAPRS